VNRAKITTGDFKRQLQELPPQMQQAVAADEKSRKDFLQDLIGIEVVLQEAKRQGLNKDPELKKRQEMLKKDLQRRIEEEFKNELFNSLLKKELAGKVPTPTDADVKKYYEAHRKEMKTADGRTLSYQEAAPQLKNWLFQQKQRELYLEFANKLKEKAKISIDEKALDAAAASPVSPASPSPHGLQLEGPPAAGPGK
jgi:peptidyl-prolyl cis-trans isomerase C